MCNKLTIYKVLPLIYSSYTVSVYNYFQSSKTDGNRLEK